MKLGILRAVLIMSFTLLIHYPKQIYSCDKKFRVDPILTIEPVYRLCLRPGAQLNITCSLGCGGGTRNGSMNHENWTLVWYHDGKILVNTVSSRGSAGELVSQITVYSTGKFTCASTNHESPWHFQNRSVNVDTVPKPLEKLDQKPVYTATGEFFHNEVVEISWQDVDPAGKHNHTLVHWLTTKPDTVTYDVITCASSICRSFFSTNDVEFIGSNVSFYVVTRSEECEAKSRVWTFFVTKKRHDAKGSLVVFIPPPPDHLYITTAFRKVTLTWDDREARFNHYAGYSYQYNNSMKSRKVTKTDILHPTTSIELTDEDIHHYTPHQEITFCVQFQWFNTGDFSQPRCNTTRLHEEIPSEAPTITCSSETCPTNDNGDKRDVTITWDLPPEENWNGVLTELKVVYYSTPELDPEQMEISVRNISSRSVVLTELNSTQQYMVTMRACTQEGCSKTGNKLQIFVRPKKVSSSSDISIILACSVTVVIIVIALSIFVCWWRRRQRQCYHGNDVHGQQLQDFYEPEFDLYDPTLDPSENVEMLDTGI